jgi:transcriptional regulator with XRE-family HTH domain
VPYVFVEAMIEARNRAGMTQADVAAGMGKQPSVARIESGGNVRSETKRYAHATRSRVRVVFELKSRIDLPDTPERPPLGGTASIYRGRSDALPSPYPFRAITVCPAAVLPPTATAGSNPAGRYTSTREPNLIMP